MTSPENDSSGTDLANVTDHVLGAPSRTSPSDGELLSKELWAKAGLTPNAKSATNRLNKKTINFDFESILNFMNLLLNQFQDLTQKILQKCSGDDRLSGARSLFQE